MVFQLSNARLQASESHRRLFARTARQRKITPETWEATLLVARTLVSEPLKGFTEYQRAMAAALVLVSFDLYARGGDMTQVLWSAVRPPVESGVEVARQWTVTFFPSGGNKTSKTHTVDDTVPLAATNPDRKWISTFLPAVRAARRDRETFFDLPSTRRRRCTL